MRRLLMIPFVLGLLAPFLWAQQSTTLITQNELKADVYFLAAPEMAGRKTTSRESRIAANYIAAEFLRLGLKPLGDDGSYFQNFDLTLAAQDDAHTVLAVRQGSVEKSYHLDHADHQSNNGERASRLSGPWHSCARVWL
jgi:hypothetical protein